MLNCRNPEQGTSACTTVTSEAASVTIAIVTTAATLTNITVITYTAGVTTLALLLYPTALPVPLLCLLLVLLLLFVSQLDFKKSSVLYYIVPSKTTWVLAISRS